MYVNDIMSDIYQVLSNWKLSMSWAATEDTKMKSDLVQSCIPSFLSFFPSFIYTCISTYSIYSQKALKAARRQTETPRQYFKFQNKVYIPRNYEQSEKKQKPEGKRQHKEQKPCGKQKVFKTREKEWVKKKGRIKGGRYDVGQGWGGERLKKTMSQVESLVW